MSKIHEAAERGDTETCTLLLERGANVNVRGVLDRTPLHFAALLGRTRVAELLRRHGGVE